MDEVEEEIDDFKDTLPVETIGDDLNYSQSHLDDFMTSLNLSKDSTHLKTDTLIKSFMRSINK